MFRPKARRRFSRLARNAPGTTSDSLSSSDGEVDLEQMLRASPSQLLRGSGACVCIAEI